MTGVRGANRDQRVLPLLTGSFCPPARPPARRRYGLTETCAATFISYPNEPVSAASSLPSIFFLAQAAELGGGGGVRVLGTGVRGGGLQAGPCVCRYSTWVRGSSGMPNAAAEGAGWKWLATNKGTGACNRVVHTSLHDLCSSHTASMPHALSPAKM